MSSNTQAAQAEVNSFKLRPDLSFRFHSDGEQHYYLLEDPVTGKFFQLGEAEYALVQRLDGKQDLDTFIAQHPDIDAQELKQFVHWLVHSQLAYIQNPNNQTWHLAPNRGEKHQKLIKILNPIFIRLSLGSPDRLLDVLYPWFSWMLGWRFFWLWLLIVFSGSYQLLANGEAFVSAANGLLSIHNALWMVLAWVLVKTIHELFHGLICKKYGGYVHQAGLFLILFAPLGGYVDANAAWRFSSKWQRIHVSVAGMFVELLIAGIAAWIWVSTEPGPLNFMAYNSIVIAGIGTLAFNANPLMRFDGYYVLSDLLNVPNLYTSGQKYVRHLGQRYLLGRTHSQPPHGPKAGLIKAYGIASWVWRITIMCSLLVLASLFSPGIGILLAGLAFITWLGIPFGFFLMGLRKDPQAKQISLRLLLIFSLFALGLLLLLTQVQWAAHYRAPAVLNYANSQTIRVESSGFVKQIAAQLGEEVRQGQLLVVLDNPELVQQRNDMRLQLQIHELQSQQYFKDKLLSAYQAEQGKIKELHQKLQELNERVAHLQLYAPTDGTVIAEQDLKLLQDQYVQRGQALFTLGDPQQIEVELSIAQDDIDFFRAHEGQQAAIYLDRSPNAEPLQAVLTRVKPAANREISHLALTALGGGPLVVQPKKQNSEQSKAPQSHEPSPAAQHEYLTPRFHGLIKLPGSLPVLLSAGETAEVVISAAPRTLGSIAYRFFSQYFSRLDQAREEAGSRF